MSLEIEKGRRIHHDYHNVNQRRFHVRGDNDKHELAFQKLDIISNKKWVSLDSLIETLNAHLNCREYHDQEGTGKECIRVILKELGEVNDV